MAPESRGGVRRNRVGLRRRSRTSGVGGGATGMGLARGVRRHRRARERGRQDRHPVGTRAGGADRREHGRAQARHRAHRRSPDRPGQAGRFAPYRRGPRVLPADDPRRFPRRLRADRGGPSPRGPGAAAPRLLPALDAPERTRRGPPRAGVRAARRSPAARLAPVPLAAGRGRCPPCRPRRCAWEQRRPVRGREPPALVRGLPSWRRSPRRPSADHESPTHPFAPQAG